MSRIGLNALFLIPGKVGGTETYVRWLLHALAQQDRGNEYFLFVNPAARGRYCPDQANFHEVCCPLPPESRIARVLWEQVMLPWQCRHYRLDLLHSLGSTGPVWLPVPSMVTIHDIQYYHYPANFGRLRRHYLRWVTPRVIRQAFRTVTVSQYTRQDVIRQLGMPDSERLVAILSGADHFPPPDPAADHEAGTCPVLQRLGITTPYLLSLAMSYPHKNLERLLQAFHQLIERPGTEALSLVLTGQAGPGHQAVLDTIQRLGLAARVRLTGYIEAEAIPHLYRHCRLYVMPSLYEGFGFPVLEAMRQGALVLCSATTSLPEVAGDAAIQFDPLDVAAITDTIHQALGEAVPRQALIERGYEQQQRFRWSDTARQLLTVYRDLKLAKDESR